MPKMKSYTGEEVYATSADGMHCQRIDGEWTDVSLEMAPRFLATGFCVIKGMDEAPEKGVAEVKRQTPHETVVEKIREMMADPKRDEEKLFTSTTGLPNLKKLTVRCNFVVDQTEMLAAWQEIQQE